MTPDIYMSTCPTCKGNRTVPLSSTAYMPCPVCDGSGEIAYPLAPESHPYRLKVFLIMYFIATIIVIWLVINS